MNELLGFLVWALLFCIVLYVVWLVIGMLKLPPPINQIVMLIIGVIGLIYLITKFGGVVGVHG